MIFIALNVILVDDEFEKKENNKHGLVPDTGDLCIGTNVKVLLDKETRSGVVRWIGTPGGLPPGKLMAAVELVRITNLYFLQAFRGVDH